MAVLAVASLSSTAIAVLACIAAAYLAARLAASRSIGAYGGAFLLAALIVAAASWLALGPLAAPLQHAGDMLFLGKFSTESGVERAAWARQALVNLGDTAGLGAGLGAARANGWAMAVLGQTGAPGAVLALGFLIAAFARRLPPDGAALRAGALAVLAAAMLSGSRVDLGPLFFVMTGCVLSFTAAPGRNHSKVAAAYAPHPV